MSFSTRNGFKVERKTIQLDSIDQDLRNGLWNGVYIIFFKKMENEGYLSENERMEVLFKRIWMYYFKQPVDNLSDSWTTTLNVVREYFFNCRWTEVYDFLEFLPQNYNKEATQTFNLFYEHINDVLETEFSAYRFIDGIITPITDKREVNEINEAAAKTREISAVNDHLNTSLSYLSDRKKPDYRNSIKESISAIEAMCRLITKGKTVDLGKALKAIEHDNKVIIHQSLKEGFIKIYGYTCDEKGIRHSLLDSKKPSFEDAKFMLVSCSAFINYLKIKADKAGIKI